MPFRFNCPACGVVLQAPVDMAGRDMRCGACHAVFAVPAPPSAPLADAEEREPADSPPPRREPERPFSERDYDDDPDRDTEPERRPRPARLRRRRPPPPSGGISALGWLAIIFGVLIVGSCACCGGGYLLLPGEKWHTYQSAEGGYSVELPVTPQKNLQLPGVKADPNLRVEGGILWKRGECYVMMYGKREDQLARDEDLLREAVQEMRKDDEVRRVVRDEPITVSGCLGREVEFEGTDDGTYIARVILSQKRVYVVLGGGRFVKPGNANIRRFLDSFQVTDPGPQRARVGKNPWRQ